MMHQPPIARQHTGPARIARPWFASTLLILTFPILAPAASILEHTSPSNEGIPYRWSVGMAASDSATLIRHVGAWSWEDSRLFTSGSEDPVGWTHFSDWVNLSLIGETVLSVTLSREQNVAWPSSENPDRTTGASVSFFPSFTVYSGTDTTSAASHTYNTHPGFNDSDTGDIGWATPLYLAHVDNSTLTSVTLSLVLAAGDYTIALGSKAPANDGDRQGYRATLSTSPVPEPGSLLFLTMAGLSAMRRRR